MSLLRKISAGLAASSKPLAEKKNQELEQAILRVAIGSLVGGYFWLGTARQDSYSWANTSAFVTLTFVILSLFLLRSVKRNPEVFVVRRLFSAALDTGTITYFSFSTPELAAPIFTLYLWIIIGNGFRFGKWYLFYTLGISAIGFGTAVAVLPYWADKRDLGAGLCIGMVIISLYLSTLVERLTGALENAKAANLAKRQFVSSVSHELRTPLNAIIGMADLLRSTKLDKHQEEMVRTMNGASKLMLSLIEEVLDFSKIEAGKLVVEKTLFDLGQMVDDTINLFKHQATERKLDLDIVINPDVPRRLIGDPTHLRQVLSNFLSNALKFTHVGGVTLKISVLHQNTEHAQLLFEVQDTGIGISAKARSHIFDSFTQADAATTRLYGGTGLGTTIAKQLVGLMGGRVGFRSEEGKGSTFWAELGFPVMPPEDPPVMQLHSEQNNGGIAQPKVQPAAPVRRYKILVAEDNATNRAVIAQILERAGHAYMLALGGEEALDALEEHEFDIVITDMNMPDLSGIDVFKSYCFMRPNTPRMPFIVLSADATQETRSECLETGVDAFLTKPIHSDALMSTIDMLVSTYREGGTGTFVPDISSAVAPQPAQASANNTEATLLNWQTLKQLDNLTPSRSFLENLIDDYIRDSTALMYEIEMALKAKRSSECRRLAHALKGSALGIGAARLCTLCEDIDVMPAVEMAANTDYLVSKLRRTHHDTRDALLRYKAERTEAALHFI